MKELITFHDLLDRTIDEAWSATDHPAALATGANVLSEKIQATGSSASQNLAVGQTENTDPMADLFLHFEWAGQAKNFLILWRDILFENQKADLLCQDGKVASDEMADLKSRSREVVQSAAASLKNFPEKKLAEIRSARNGEKKQLAEWKLQADPWPKYEAQISQLAEQCADLHQGQSGLLHTSATLRTIRSLVDEAVIFCQTEMGNFKATVGEAEAFIKANEADPGKVAAYLEEMEVGLKTLSYANTFSHTLDLRLAELEEKTQVPVSVEDGLVQQREVPFRRRTQQWLESEILPLLYEVWELTERTGNSLKMALVNIRNRALLLSKNEVEMTEGSIDLSQPIPVFLKNATENEKELKEYKSLISSRLDEGFEFSAIFRSVEFLPVPLQSTIEQMRLDQSPLLVKLRDWGKRLDKRLRKVRSDAAEENLLSTSEKIVRFVQARTPSSENSHYSNIFLTRGYVGESFVVGRKSELAHIRKVVENWRLGFRGAVILSGRRFSGKSLFGELVANRHFIGHTIRLSPNAELQVGSRRMATTTDLDAALSFIEKHTLGERQLIWLDDLELWAGSATPLSQNMRHLIRSIDGLSDRLFFLVSMSNWTKAHLHRFHHVKNIFQADVNLDQMSAAEIRQAILIRHGATHRALVDAEGKEITPQQFQKMTERIFNNSRGNIGDALNLWSAATHRVDDDRVRHAPAPGSPLPDFLRSDSRLLLRTLLLEKRTNEYRLRRIFGPAFKEKYGGLLQRFLLTGLLSRQLDGWLEVNEVVANEVGRKVFGE